MFPDHRFRHNETKSRVSMLIQINVVITYLFVMIGN